jgi:selenocysteine-specific elongation factor
MGTKGSGPPAARAGDGSGERVPSAGGHGLHGIIGTAGHVDHGKTTLVRALTGVDTDRLPEERRRGISIDLGFAALQLPGGSVAGIVDVPGHERFVRNMVAGASGVDLCLLVVAADEGVMPQTREHLDIVLLLGVARAVVAITKADLVEPAWLELVEDDVRALLAPTPLRAAPLVRVSAVRGEGLDTLRRLLEEGLVGAAAHQDRGFVRLPVDRVFSVPGFGTVVTGTLTSGAVALEDRLELLPGGRPVRVRGIEVHGRPLERAGAGQRVALNLAGIDRAEARRGDVVATPGTLKAETLWTVRLRALERVTPWRAGGEAPPLRHGDALHVHVGTAEAVGRLALLEGEALARGQEGFAQLRLDRPLAVGRGDRFIVRSYSPVVTVGGGVVLAVGSRVRRGDVAALASLAALERGAPEDLLLEAARGPVPLPAAEVARKAGLPASEADPVLDQLVVTGRLGALDDGGVRLLAWPSTWDALRRGVLAQVEAYHAQHPLRPGLPREELRQVALRGLDARAAAAVVAALAAAGDLRVHGEHVASPAFAPSLPLPWVEPAERLVALLAAAGLTPPSVPEALAAAGFPGDGAARREFLAFLEQQGRLVRVGELCFAPQAVAAAAERVRAFLRVHGAMTVAELRDLLGVTRRHAVPLAEYLDASHVTRREGDVRRLA